MEDLNIEWLGQCSLNKCHVRSIPLVSSNHRIGSPVGPINVIFKQSDSERVRERIVIRQHYVMVFPVIRDRVNRIGSEIRKQKHVD